MSDELLSKILDELRKGRVNALWNLADIAAYLQLSQSTVSKRIVNHAAFPAAIRLPTSDEGKGGRRWQAQEVKQWAVRHREIVR